MSIKTIAKRLPAIDARSAPDPMREIFDAFRELLERATLASRPAPQLAPPPPGPVFITLDKAEKISGLRASKLRKFARAGLISYTHDREGMKLRASDLCTLDPRQVEGKKRDDAAKGATP